MSTVSSYSRIVTALLMAAGLASVAGGEVRYVDDDAPPGGDGTAWKTAYRHLQDALAEAAAAGGAITEVRIGRGTYIPDRGAGVRAGDRDATFALLGGVAVRGGYAGLGAEDPDAQDVAGNVTALSGDLLGDDGPAFAGRAENSFHVVTALRVDETARLEGVHVSGGRANGPNEGPTPESRDQGSAVNVYHATPWLVDCTFESNWALNHGTVNDHGGATLVRCTFRANRADNLAGGLYSHHDVTTLAQECVFIDNVTPGNGGGAYNKGSADVTYLDCAFIGNQAEKGGGAYTEDGSSTTIEGCRFEENLAVDGGGLYANVSNNVVVDSWFALNTAFEGDGGGAMWNEGGTPTVTGCRFDGNAASKGAAIYNKLSSAIITDCTFDENAAVNGGGGGVWSDGCCALIADCTFTANSASKGGGLYNEDASIVVQDCAFIGNTAIDGDGGGGMTNAFGSAALVLDCTFIDNVSNNNLFGGGGGMANYASAPTVIGCLFRRNTASLGGGGMYNENGFGGPSPIVIDCAFEGNRSEDGGGMYNFRSGPEVTNCTFVGNVLAGSGHSWGGGLFNHFKSDARVTNCTFSGNAADLGGAINNAQSAPLVTNCIAWGDVGGELGGDPGDVRYSLVAGGQDGDGNVDADPRFAAPPDPGFDGVFGTDDDDYGDLRLAGGSPCVDAGHDWAVPDDALDRDGDGDVSELLPLDLGGNPRFADGGPDAGCGGPATVDMGAFEATGAPWMPARRGDVDFDGVIGALDLGALLAAWGECPGGCCPADVDYSGRVAFADLLALLSNWG